MREMRRRGLEPMPMVDTALTAGTGGLLLARAVYVAFHWAYYQDHIREAMRPWGGGLAWQGALIGGLIGAGIAATLQRMSLPVVLDVLTPGAASLASFAWLACHTAGCAYGIETYPGDGLLWTLSRDLPNLYGIREPRVAVQLLGAAYGLLLLGGVLLAGRSPGHNGVVFAGWLTLHSLGTFGLGLLRADEMALIAGWRVDQVANLSLSAAGLVMVAATVVTSTKSFTRGASPEQ